MKKIAALLAITTFLSFRLPQSNGDIVGMEIKGDFNGDKKPDLANAGPIRQFHFDQHMDGVGWMVKFDDIHIPELTLGCCLSYLINEGDLNKDGSDELSVYAYSGDMSDCAYYISTFTLVKPVKPEEKPEWKKIIGPFAVAKGCEGFTSDDLLTRVTLEKNGSVYYRVDTNGITMQKKAF